MVFLTKQLYCLVILAQITKGQLSHKISTIDSHKLLLLVLQDYRKDKLEMLKL